MEIKTDIHCHTVASTHAYSTVLELVAQAKKRNMEAIAITDHGFAIPDSPHPWHFENLKNIPRNIDGINILYGCEANITDINGTIDMPERLMKKMDIVVASIHRPCYENNGAKDNTSAYLGALDCPYVDVLGHTGNPQYPYEYDPVLLKAKQLHKIIEINTHSFMVRPQNIERCKNIAIRCKELGVSICVNSDAHFSFDVGEYTPAIKMLKEIEFPIELIVNRTLSSLKEYLSPRKTINI